MAGSSYQVLQDQINALGASMDKGFAKLEGMLSAYEARTRALENQEARCQPIITNRLDNIAVKIAEDEKLIEVIKAEVDAIKLHVTALQNSNKILSWFAGIAGSAVIIWLVSSLLALVK
ncbi:MAG TPA: hypothetical protein VFF78_06750 [Anaerolineaceae bacterium]|nr:hypothetical protein [Anaerolineaceae bacterium]